MHATPFSLLLPVYSGDRAEDLRKAFTSSAIDQDVRPDQVVIVQDGPVGAELTRVIAEIAATSEVVVDHVRLDANLGLARALEIGLQHCIHDVVARMDADDVSLPSRFAQQIPLIDQGYDLVGTGMYEFDEDGRILGSRTPPVDGDAIRSVARFRDPFNHPTVVYRRSEVAKAGGYRELPLMEDYWLFARMIQAGTRVANVAAPLVMYRVNAGAYSRRGGNRLFRSELALQREFLRSGFVTPLQYLRNVCVRGVYRFVPVAIRRRVYRRFMVADYIGDSEKASRAASEEGSP